jgi:TPR repeat protein
MSTTADDIILKCAACGKDGDDLKACTACKLVKYCNATCQRANWPMHKKECKKRAAELHDEALFKEPLEREECDICMLPLPLDIAEQKYQPCCGKLLCFGCIHAAYMADNRQLCPFCRTPEGSALEKMKKRAEGGNDAIAIHQLGCRYECGSVDLPRDCNKAMELWYRAGELGCPASYGAVGQAYFFGDGVERDMKKAKHYHELAAMGGGVTSHHCLGVLEAQAGNMDRAVQHFMISAGAGLDESLKEIKECFMKGLVTKADFERALRAHKEANDEMKSEQREAAAALIAARAARLSPW